MTKDETGQSGGGEKYDLEERTAHFGENVIDFLKAVRRDDMTSPLVGQLMRAAGGVGANYCEANDAVSRKEFRHRIALCRRESKESKHWLRLIARADDRQLETARTLWKEAKELNLIFASILRGLDKE